MLKKFLSLILVFSMICITTSHAISVPVTNESLAISLQKFLDSNGNDKNVKVKVANNIISMNLESGEYSFNYDLTNKPTFSYTAEIKEGMSYELYKKETGNLSAPILGYLAIANIHNVDYSDSMLYISMSMLSNALSDPSSVDAFSVIDDTNLSEGVSIIKEPNNTKTIYASEFGNHAIEYTKKLYGNPHSFNDAEGINSFEWIQELKDITDTSCKIVSTLVVNPDADFSQIIGTSEKMGESFSNSFITEETNSVLELTDIEDTKYENAVKELAELGVVNGFEDNTFRPTENVTRAQFAKMLVEALNLKLNDNSTSMHFTDLSETHWAYDYIKIAVDNGIINGYPDATFRADNSVTYAESMAMILRAMKIEETMTDKSWPLGYINEAREVGLLDLVDYNEPNIPANRGETAISLFNMINIIGNNEDNTPKTTYSNENGVITLKKVSNEEIDLDYSGPTDSIGLTLNYSNGIASKEDEFFGENYKVIITFNNDEITIEASSDNPSSNFKKLNGTYHLQAN